MSEEDKKERLLKSVKNIGKKTEELLKAFSAANKVSKALEHENDFNYNFNYTFYRFYRDSEKFKKMVSKDSKHGEFKEFYELLSAFKNLKPVTIEKKIVKIELSTTSIYFTINILILTKKIMIVQI